MRNRKGFTLVELAIVMVLIAVVVTMAVTFAIQYNRISNEYIDHKTVMNDISITRDVIADWIRQYDNVDYTFVASGHTLEAKATGKSTEQLVSEGNKLYWKRNGVTVTTYELGDITDCTFSFDTIVVNNVASACSNVVRCRLAFEDSELDVLFTLFSTTARSRYSPKDR